MEKCAASVRNVMKTAKVERESRIEKTSRLIAEKNGWFQVKIERTSINGFPDRLFIRNGQTVYVEFKNSAGRLSLEQQRVIDTMREHGAVVYVISSVEEANVIFR